MGFDERPARGRLDNGRRQRGDACFGFGVGGRQEVRVVGRHANDDSGRGLAIAKRSLSGCIEDGREGRVE
jgi:hypothetical protein